jgi:NAD(P)-dependent dehydrogenase (short-subunit alcohol dehydrogenase family)
MSSDDHRRARGAEGDDGGRRVSAGPGSFASFPPGRVALVTGGASGIGRACALAFAGAGVSVVVADQDEAGAAETCRLGAAGPGELAAVACDVSDPDQARAAVAVATDRFGRLDHAVNCAGILDREPEPMATFPVEVFDRTIAVNLRGMFLSLQAELAVMAAQGSGSIVVLSSGAGIVGVPAVPGYSASKHGAVGLARAAALDYALQGIRVNAICPGVIDTPMARNRGPEVDASHPMGRIGLPGEIAAAALWLCSPGSSFVTGVALPVDGGYTAR